MRPAQRGVRVWFRVVLLYESAVLAGFDEHRVCGGMGERVQLGVQGPVGWSD